MGGREEHPPPDAQMAEATGLTLPMDRVAVNAEQLRHFSRGPDFRHAAAFFRKSITRRS